MKQRIFGFIVLAAGVAVALSVVPTRVAGQEGKAGTSAKATPRMPDGHPDLNGMWYRRVPPVPTVERIGKSIILNPRAPRDPNAPPSAITYNAGTPPYKPELLAKVKELNQNQIYADPAYGCGAPGVPRIGPPQRIIQTAREVVILYDDMAGSFYRYIPIDGRQHRKDIEASGNGDSVGRWEGDTLVIDVRNIREDTWLGDNGLFHSASLHVTERLRREGDALTWEAIVEDPIVFVEPWKMTPRTVKLMTNIEIEEAPPCQERDLANATDLTHHSNTR